MNFKKTRVFYFARKLDISVIERFHSYHPGSFVANWTEYPSEEFNNINHHDFVLVIPPDED